MALRHGIFVSGASGGVTSPQDARLALAGLLSGPGVLNGLVVTGSTSGPNMKYLLPAGSAATQRGTLAADGLYLLANDGSITLDSGQPAPASGTRYDVVWVRHKNAFDGGFGDANSDPDAGVAVGTASSTPSVPTVPAGALAVAQALVGTSIANASLATITQVAPSVTAAAFQRSTSDWNTAMAPGFYVGGATNAPASHTYVGVVLADGSGNVVQQVWRSTAGSAASYETWTRNYNAGAWGAWLELSTTAAAQFTGTTDGSGYMIVTHNLPFTPVAVVATPKSPITAGAAVSILMAVLTDTFTSTTFRARCLNAAGGAMASTAVSFSAVMG